MSIKLFIFTLGIALSIQSTMAGTKLKPRIVNGVTSLWGQFPYYAYLESVDFRGYNGICGGVIISDQWILTSGFCIRGMKQVTIHFGSIIRRDLMELDRLVVIVNPESFYIHPLFFPIGSVGAHDIGLIRLKTPLDFTYTIQSIALPNTCDPIGNANAFVMGFGLTNTTEKKLATLLQWTSLYTVPKDQCEILYPDAKLYDGVDCAVDVGEGSLCIGDSGSPIVRFDDSVLIGISNLVSYPHGCESSAPKPFTNILPYLSWISSVTGMKLPICPIEID